MRLRCGRNLNDVQMNGFTLVFWWINWLVVIYCLNSLSTHNDHWNHPKLNQSFWKETHQRCMGNGDSSARKNSEVLRVCHNFIYFAKHVLIKQISGIIKLHFGDSWPCLSVTLKPKCHGDNGDPCLNALV